MSRHKEMIQQIFSLIQDREVIYAMMFKNHSVYHWNFNPMHKCYGNLRSFICIINVSYTGFVVVQVLAFIIKRKLIIRHHSCQQWVFHSQWYLTPLKVKLCSWNHPIAWRVLRPTHHLCWINKLEQLWGLHWNRWPAREHCWVDVHIGWPRWGLLSHWGEMCADECWDKTWFLSQVGRILPLRVLDESNIAGFGETQAKEQYFLEPMVDHFQLCPCDNGQIIWLHWCCTDMREMLPRSNWFVVFAVIFLSLVIVRVVL